MRFKTFFLSIILAFWSGVLSLWVLVLLWFLVSTVTVLAGPQTRKAAYAAEALDGCQACRTTDCTAKDCKEYQCERGQCKIEDCYWVSLSSGDHALLCAGVHIGSYRPGVGYRPLKGDEWGPYQPAPVAFPLPVRAAYIPAYAPVPFLTGGSCRTSG